MTELVNIRTIDPANPDVQILINELDKYQSQLYPPESNHLDDINVLRSDQVLMVGAFLSGKLVGIGAVKFFPAYGELKRMFVSHDFRGRGVADSILGTLEKVLVKRKIYVARLETGIHQHAAIQFYRKFGYQECPAFAPYRPDPFSLFMEKSLQTE